MYLTTLVTQPYELEQMAALSKNNLRMNVPDSEKATQGFVTWNYTTELLQNMHTLAPSIIVKENEQVVGYALTALKSAAGFQTEMIPMIQHLNRLTFKGRSLNDYSYYIMGQICIAREHRGRGLFERLYAHHKTIYQSQFELLATEVSTSNTRSRIAHQKVGFTTIDTYRDPTDEWEVVVWDWL